MRTEPLESDDWKKPPSKKKGRGRFLIQYRLPPDTFCRSYVTWFHDWTLCGRYHTRKQRDEALEVLVRKDKFFEYRKVDP